MHPNHLMVVLGLHGRNVTRVATAAEPRPKGAFYRTLSLVLGAQNGLVLTFDI